ncbi:MAG: hypothetical protein ACRCZF_01415, partial [Gemmataceae bacterium]
MVRSPAMICVLFCLAPAAFSAEPTPTAAPTPDLVQQATDLFRQATAEPAKYTRAAALFARAMNNKVELSPSQLTAWAYCRVRVAAERFNASPTDPAVRRDVIAEVTDAVGKAPEHAELFKFATTVVTAAGGRLPAPVKAAPIPAPASPSTTPPPTTSGWQLIESNSFQVRFQGEAAAAETLLRTAEELRTAQFTKWSGPPRSSWSPKCEIVLHASATAFAAATGRPAASTGTATVRLVNKQAAERRIDLRADDGTMLENALPRELMHVVLADLFVEAAPPLWAEEGLCV